MTRPVEDVKLKPGDHLPNISAGGIDGGFAIRCECGQLWQVGDTFRKPQKGTTIEKKIITLKDARDAHRLHFFEQQSKR